MLVQRRGCGSSHSFSSFLCRFVPFVPLVAFSTFSPACETNRYDLAPCIPSPVCGVPDSGTITTNSSLELSGGSSVSLRTVNAVSEPPKAILEFTDSCGSSVFLGPFKEGKPGSVSIDDVSYTFTVSVIGESYEMHKGVKKPVEIAFVSVASDGCR